MRTTLRRSLLLGALTASVCFANDTSYNPLNMPIGTTYTIVFVTIDVIKGSSTDIASFNNLVVDEVDEVLPAGAQSLSWCAVVSTASVNAIDNCGQDNNAGGAIYNLYDGNEVADSFSDFTTGALMNTITQFDGGSSRLAWTGSGAGGVADNPLGVSPSEVGYPQANLAGWFDFSTNVDTSFNDVIAMAEITVEAPEISSLGLVTTGVLLLALVALRRSGRKAARGGVR